MKRLFIQTKMFSDDLDALIAEKKLLEIDYEELENLLAENPELGSLIQGTGGLRKTRLKSSSKGKRVGFRVCYFDSPEDEQLFFIVIYGKNEKENLSKEDKTIFNKIIQRIKRP